MVGDDFTIGKGSIGCIQLNLFLHLVIDGEKASLNGVKYLSSEPNIEACPEN